jgi:hypothetical protein
MSLISRWTATLSSDNSGRADIKEMRRFNATAVSQVPGARHGCDGETEAKSTSRRSDQKTGKAAGPFRL